MKAAGLIRRFSGAMPKQYYAVVRGRVPGVYSEWPAAERQTKGFGGSVYKGFKSENEAWAWYREQGGFVSEEQGEVVREELGAVAFPSHGPVLQSLLSDIAQEPSSFDQDMNSYEDLNDATGSFGVIGGHTLTSTLQNEISSNDTALRRQLNIPTDAEVVYTDGACPSNGQTSSTAGIGVFYGINDPRNISLRLPGLYQTNQRAELHAVVKALESYPTHPPRTLVIITDSKYVMKGLTEWSLTWEKNNYLNSQKQSVISKDLFIRARRRIKELGEGGVAVEFRHVMGHKGVWGNEMADRLAVAGAGSGHVVDESMEWEWEDEELDREIAEGRMV